MEITIDNKENELASPAQVHDSLFSLLTNSLRLGMNPHELWVK